MDASSGPSHLRRRAPHSMSLDHRSIDNDSVNEIEEIVASTGSVDALQSSSPSALNTLSEAGQNQRTSSKSPRNPLWKQIFLSHSGKQKPFVQQLNEDLRQVGYLPFFDTDPVSLPAGEWFPELILQAARECEVAVVVLSQEYLLSKWPMIELAAFVEAQKSDKKKLKILPLFYKLEVSAIKDDKEMQRKMSDTWETYAKEDKRIDPKKWGNAVRKLSGNNGLVFDNVSEAAYRKAIVKSIYNLCLPHVEFDLTNMEGKDRLCPLVAGELEKRLEEGKTATLGLHGTGGLGKTMLCKALCINSRQRFDGRVCYVDFGSGNSLEMKKEILKRLTVLRSELTLNHLILEQQVDDALKEFLPQQEVFMAIDNLPPEFATASMAPIFKSLSKRSMCIVTARSPETLKKVPSLDVTNINPIPSLTEAEAMNVFLHVALSKRSLSSLLPDELEIVRTCVNRCILDRSTSIGFPEFRVPADTVYHPMTLKALANSMKQAKALDPLEWAREGRIPEILNDDDMSSIYRIIEKLYMTLHDADKVLFMDLAVFAPREKLYDLDDFLKWLEAVHDMDRRRLYTRLKKFEALSFLEIREDSVKMHDFYIDFAHYQLPSEEDSIRKQCVFKAGGDALPLCLQRTPSGRCWEELVRVKLQVSPNRSVPIGSIRYVENNLFYRFPGQKLWEWANLVVLHLEFGGEHIDIGPLRCLRALDLEADHNLKTFTCTNPFQQLQFVRFRCMLGLVKEVPSFTSTLLQELEMMVDMVSLPKAVAFPPASASLTILRLSRWYSSLQHHDLNFGAFPNLTEIIIESVLYFHCFIGCNLYISGLSELTKLRKLALLRLPIAGPLLGLEKLTGLEELILTCCYNITSLPGLGSLTNVTYLSVSMTQVEELPGLENLLKLKELLCMGCLKLRSLPDLRALPELHTVHAQMSTLVGNVSVSESCIVVQPNVEVLDAFTAMTSGMNAVEFGRLVMDDYRRNVEEARGRRATANRSAHDAHSDHATEQAEGGRADAQHGAQETEDRSKEFTNLWMDEMGKAISHPAWTARVYSTFMRVVRDMAQHYWDNLPTIKKVGAVILGPLMCVILVVGMNILVGGLIITFLLRPAWGNLSTVQKVRAVILLPVVCVILVTLIYIILVLLIIILIKTIFARTVRKYLGIMRASLPST